MTGATDKEDLPLVRRMLAGDDEAFETFSDTYLPALYRLAYNRLGGDRELTREIVQATVCKVVAHLESFRAEATLLTWMSSICRNEIAMHFRQQSRRPQEVEWTADIEAVPAGVTRFPGNDAEETMIQNERTTLVHMVLDLLPSHYARALEWKYLDDLPVKEIARRLQIGEKAAESLLTRARQSFRAHYDGNVDVIATRDDPSTAVDRRAVLE